MGPYLRSLELGWSAPACFRLSISLILVGRTESPEYQIGRARPCLLAPNERTRDRVHDEITGSSVGEVIGSWEPWQHLTRS
jgi:hypothetical protein